MAGSVPTTPVVPPPRRPLDPVVRDHRDGPDARARHWYENDLGWPTVPGRPLRLLTGVRFDVLDVPAEAGAAAFRHLAPGSPVALRDDRMLLLVAAGSAEALPEVLDWLEWGAEAPALDLRALGAGGAMEAPVPPAAVLPPPRGPGSACCVTSPFRAVPDGGAAVYGRDEGASGFAGYGMDFSPGRGESPGHRAGDASDFDRNRSGSVRSASDSVLTGEPVEEVDSAESVGSGSSPGSGADRAGFGAGSVQGAAVWLRPPEPGGEAEASLPALPAMGGSKGAPDLVRLVDTVAARCHRIRLRRASARPSACRRDQPLAFS